MPGVVVMALDTIVIDHFPERGHPCMKFQYSIFSMDFGSVFEVGVGKILENPGSDVNALDKYSKFSPLDYVQDGEPEMRELLEGYDGICTSC